MIHIHAKDQETFLQSIGFNQIDDIRYVTCGCDDHRIEWHGLHGHDEEHQYSIVRDMDAVIWYMNGKRHRDGDLPAVICADGQQEWWVNGKRHRENDLPAVIYTDGSQEWWVNGMRIRRK